MESVKSIVKKGNELLCGDKSFLKSICGDSMKGNKGKNFLLLISISLAVQYLIPVIIIIMLVPFIVINVLAAGVIGFMAFLNPLFLFLFAPLGIVDMIIITVVVIAWLFIMGLYMFMNFKSFGTLSLIPMVMMFAAFLLRFVPYIGDILATIISITPWMTIMIGIYYFTYKEPGSWDIAKDTVDFLKERGRQIGIV